ncbi:hypothetical protein [Actinospica sp.]|jgi:hypothetical protein|uniref:hypothetical protein n=1 Tax=Actinospica sp. TaxID=1872142 RepID=UPI002CB85F80|nr:hypothetical protein [Actinospica sp.]HWG27234.1 hypothetical protein [Actinospica sp.]
MATADHVKQSSRTKNDTSTRPSAQSRAAKQQAPVYRLTVPVDRLDQAAADTAAALVRTPVAVARRVAPMAHGLPVYLGLGGLAALGAVEWPVAAAAGVGFAALRRWGPLRGDTAE